VGGGHGQWEGERAVLPANREGRDDVGTVLQRDVRAGISRQRGRGEGRAGERVWHERVASLRDLAGVRVVSCLGRPWCIFGRGREDPSGLGPGDGALVCAKD
jgi:hypothetical protein